MKTVVFSDTENWYYIKELSCPSCNWISTKKFDEEPNTLHTFEYKIKYDDIYYRIIRPFRLWKIKIGNKKQIEDNDELVKDYHTCGHKIADLKFGE